jgi:hypothetical protein
MLNILQLSAGYEEIKPWPTLRSAGMTHYGQSLHLNPEELKLLGEVFEGSTPLERGVTITELLRISDLGPDEVEILMRVYGCTPLYNSIGPGHNTHSSINNCSGIRAFCGLVLADVVHGGYVSTHVDLTRNRLTVGTEQLEDLTSLSRIIGWQIGTVHEALKHGLVNQRNMTLNQYAVGLDITKWGTGSCYLEEP